MGVGHRFQNPCDGMRNARLKREDAFSHAMIIVSSAMVSSWSCRWTRAKSSLSTSRRVSVIASAYSSATFSASLKSGLLGDGIMALFGAPLAHEDHAVRACYAALRMQDSVKRYAEEVHRAVGVALYIRVGLNSGEVVVRSIGSDLRLDYTAVGQTTHLAARMEQMAMPGSILISPATLELVEGYVVVRALGLRPIKGLESPIDVFEVTAAGSARSRLQATAARGLTRFVGRDAEMEVLRRALATAARGQGQVTAVVGEPGIGESRLVHECVRSRRADGWLVLESRSVSYGRATSFLSIVDLLRTYFRVEMRDDPPQIREKATGKLLTLDRAVAPMLPALLALLDVAVDDASWQTLDPPQRHRRTLDAITRLLLREAQVQPLLLVFEDLHWVDPDTQVVLLLPEDKRLLQAAAVIGHEVPFALLEAIAEESDDRLRRQLVRLQAAEFLDETTLFPEPEYTFRHALTLDVAYQSLLRERRCALHGRVLDALERQWTGREQEQIELRAHHAGRAELWARAARYLYQAGERAFARARYQVCAASCQAAIEALDRLGAAADLTLKLDACSRAMGRAVGHRSVRPAARPGREGRGAGPRPR